MNEREHAVLSLFYDEGHEEVTPSLLAYRMRMSTRDATKLLDGMVKDDTLNLNVDDEGHISYRLPPSERHRIGQRRNQKQTGDPSSDPRSSTARDDTDRRRDHYRRSRGKSGRTGDGTDATPNDGRSNRQRPATHGATRRQGPDGTDGSVGPTTGSVAGATPYRPDDRSWEDTSSPDRSGKSPEDWYIPPDEPAESGNTGHAGTTAGGWTEPDPGQRQQPHPPQPNRQQQNRHQSGRTDTRTRERQYGPGQVVQNAHQQGGVPDNQSLAPYQQAQNGPTDTEGGPRRQRIPVLAGALSLLIPGLGQFYNGEIGKGVMLLFSYLFLWVFWLFWIVHIWSIIDAYMVAEHSSHRLPDESDGSQPPLLPDQQPQNSSRNSSAA